ncbi:hypothetical protein [Aquitalea aquatica]|uniref:Uncharacterized protein n=1 Tax=Aquitalea aquatica TaxID=3044273 RepID=A0A838Y119_9NEIS|nr:hypothetical protein [Aquitalea magnusonii]MBA4709130.1 hypothetical protein [Aquitalea magnusonii]
MPFVPGALERVAADLVRYRRPPPGIENVGTVFMLFHPMMAGTVHPASGEVAVKNG